jgi:hypothetical protein
LRRASATNSPANPRRRPVIAAVLSFLVLSAGFVAIVLLLLHWAAPSTN